MISPQDFSVIKCLQGIADGEFYSKKSDKISEKTFCRSKIIFKNRIFPLVIEPSLCYNLKAVVCIEICALSSTAGTCRDSPGYLAAESAEQHWPGNSNQKFTE